MVPESVKLMSFNSRTHVRRSWGLRREGLRQRNSKTSRDFTTITDGESTAFCSVRVQCGGERVDCGSPEKFHDSRAYLRAYGALDLIKKVVWDFERYGHIEIIDSTRYPIAE